MTNREIYAAALAVLGESEAYCEDYEARAPALLSLAVRECAARDAEYRSSRTGEACESVTVTPLLPLDDAFLPDERFATAVSYFLAGMLIQREDDAFASVCFAHGEASCDRILRQETHALLQPIRPMP